LEPRNASGTTRYLEGHSPIVQLIGGDDRRLAVIEPGEGDLGAAIDEGY
jgi:hypothetical protein